MTAAWLLVIAAAWAAVGLYLGWDRLWPPHRRPVEHARSWSEFQSLNLTPGTLRWEREYRAMWKIRHHRVMAGIEARERSRRGKPDHFDRYPCARREIERALAANHGSIWGVVRRTGRPDDPREAGE